MESAYWFSASHRWETEYPITASGARAFCRAARIESSAVVDQLWFRIFDASAGTMIGPSFAGNGLRQRTSPDATVEQGH